MPESTIAKLSIVKTQVKERVIAIEGAAANTKISEGFYESLDLEVSSLLARAYQRMKQNGRKTLLPKDL